MQKITMPWDRFPSQYFKNFNLFELVDSLESLDKNENSKYPPYNIRHQNDENGSKYILDIAVAGFNRKELQVGLIDDELSVSGKKDETSNSENYIHKGIAFRTFKQKFKLHPYCEVKSVELNDGILTVVINNEKPKNCRGASFEIK